MLRTRNNSSLARSSSLQALSEFTNNDEVALRFSLASHENTAPANLFSRIFAHENEIFSRGKSFSSLSKLQSLDSGFFGLQMYEEDMESQWRESVYNFLSDPHSSKYAFLFASGILVLILLSVLLFCIQSLPEYVDNEENFFLITEAIIVGIFSIEYLLRLVTCPMSRLSFMTQPLNVIDLLSIIPFYIEVALARRRMLSFTLIRVLRLAKVFRLFRLSRISSEFHTVIVALFRARDALILSLFLVCILVVFFASSIYILETTIGCTFDQQAQVWIYQEDFEPGVINTVSPFQSIPDVFWFSVVTISNVGYGFETPVTPYARFVTSFCMLGSILAIAFPISVIGSYYQNVSDERDRQNQPGFAYPAPHPNPTTASIGELLLHIRSNNGIMSNSLKVIESAVTELREANGSFSNPLEIASNKLLRLRVTVDRWLSNLEQEQEFPISGEDEKSV